MTTDDLTVFFGDLTFHRAVVYARLARPADDAGLSLAGQVRGPRCLHSQTLPATSPLVDLGPGPTLLARAVLPDPCCWSADVPQIYDVIVNVLRGTEIIATARREVGLRPLGTRGRDLLYAGKRVVLRGVSTTSTSAKLPRDWHETSAVYVAGDPSDEALAEASQWGALAVVHLPASGDEAVARLRKLAEFPAAAIAIPLGDMPADFQKSAVCPNLLLGQFLGPDQAFHVEPWADLLVISADSPDHLQTAAALDKPVIVARYLEQPLDISAARAACDELQRDLAPISQFAGYIV
ncbi:MAG: hypothetical protein SFU86_14215 [Pirellulaceae bacterium]|nr:hypothetical protein [Pirellulaceae bacterium]